MQSFLDISTQNFLVEDNFNFTFIFIYTKTTSLVKAQGPSYSELLFLSSVNKFCSVIISLWGEDTMANIYPGGKKHMCYYYDGMFEIVN